MGRRAHRCDRQRDIGPRTDTVNVHGGKSRSDGNLLTANALFFVVLRTFLVQPDRIPCIENGSLYVLASVVFILASGFAGGVCRCNVASADGASGTTWNWDPK
jgi:hypothetical protein